MRRGEVWWANLPDPTGSGPGLRRPVVVVQSNPFNASRIATVVVVVVTSNLTLAEAPGNFRLSKSESGLSKASVANVSQVITLDRSVLSTKVKALPDKAIARLNEGLKLVLGL